MQLTDNQQQIINLFYSKEVSTRLLGWELGMSLLSYDELKYCYEKTVPFYGDFPEREWIDNVIDYPFIAMHGNCFKLYKENKIPKSILRSCILEYDKNHWNFILGIEPTNVQNLFIDFENDAEILTKFSRNLDFAGWLKYVDYDLKLFTDEQILFVLNHASKPNPFYSKQVLPHKRFLSVLIKNFDVKLGFSFFEKFVMNKFKNRKGDRTFNKKSSMSLEYFYEELKYSNIRRKKIRKLKRKIDGYYSNMGDVIKYQYIGEPVFEKGRKLFYKRGKKFSEKELCNPYTEKKKWGL